MRRRRRTSRRDGRCDLAPPRNRSAGHASPSAARRVPPAKLEPSHAAEATRQQHGRDACRRSIVSRLTPPCNTHRASRASLPARHICQEHHRERGRRKEKKERKQREKKKKKMIESCDFANKPSSFGKSHVCLNWKFHVLNPDFFSKYINNPLHWDICLNGIRNLQNH